MEKETIGRLVGILVTVLLLSILLPRLITLVSNHVVERIMKGSTMEEGDETEDIKETERIFTSLPLEEEVMKVKSNSEDPMIPAVMETEESDVQKEKIQFDERLEMYRKQVEPEYTALTENAIQEFIGNRQTEMNAAIADHLFSLYDDRFQVKQIELLELVRDDEKEISYHIEVFVEDERDAYSEFFICSYNKVLDYYSLYGYL